MGRPREIKFVSVKKLNYSWLDFLAIYKDIESPFEENSENFFSRKTEKSENKNDSGKTRG